MDVDDEPPASTEALSDLEWMKRHMSKKADVEEKAFEQSDDEETGEQKVGILS
jgi:multiple RNA-binding domain-containing protein 1